MLPFPATSQPPSPVPSMGEWDAEVQADLDDPAAHPHHPQHHSQHSSLTTATSNTLKRIVHATTAAATAGIGAATAIDSGHTSSSSLSSSSTNVTGLGFTAANGGMMTASDLDGLGSSSLLSTSPSKLPPGLKKLRKRTSQSQLGVAAKRILYEPTRQTIRQLSHDNVLRARVKLFAIAFVAIWTVVWFAFDVNLVAWLFGTLWWRNSGAYGYRHGSRAGAGGHASYNPKLRKPAQAHARLRWATEQTVSNWGDHVGLGRARQDVLDRTPRPYTDIGDHWMSGQKTAHLYFKRRTLDEIRKGLPAQHHEAGEDDAEGAAGGDDGNKKAKRNSDFERDRHGVMGGASVEWSKGVVGSGKYLGEFVDMRKDGSYDPREDELGYVPNEHVLAEDDDDDVDDVDDDDDHAAANDREESGSGLHVRSSSDSSLSFESLSTRELVHKAERRALIDHILDQGWVYLDEEDKTNTEKLLAQAKKEGFMDSLPLRDRVRGDLALMEEAAIGWSRIYTAQKGEWQKSALEVSLERMVRRVPIIVFSKTTCPYSTRAKELLKMYRLSPAPQIVEVDMRPDQKALVGLLKRRTNHATFPNIIIGSRSIGGADDMEKLAKTGELADLFDEVGVRHGKWKWGGDHNDD
ncbi:hypothetical protein OIV83_004454 [Microbotryomycetes sp. JL201]|nr:hypothetical protein OIV83_004454 [Microbotryomycetes sp. JL201]